MAVGDMGAPAEAATGGNDGGESIEVSGLSSEAASDVSEAAEGGSGAAAAQRLKLKWLGREEEIDDPGKLAERFSDAYRYKFRGPKGADVEATWPEIERHVQLSAGAQEAIKRARARETEIQQQIEWGKDPANLPSVLEQLFGVEDVEGWAFQLANQALQRENELAELAVAAGQDRTGQTKLELQRRMQQQFNEREKRKRAWTEQQQQRQGEQQKRQAESQQREQAVRNEMQQLGINGSVHNLARAAHIVRENRELGIELEPRQLAHELRKQLDNEVLSHLDGLPVEKLLSFLGDGRRAKLREAELAAVKAAKKAEATKGAPKREAASNGVDKPKGKDVDSFRIPGFGGGL